MTPINVRISKLEEAHEQLKVKIADYKKIIPIGYNCATAMVLINLNLRKEAYPLDWVISNPFFVYQYIKTDFKDYFLKTKNDNTNYLGQKFDWFKTTDNHNTQNHKADIESDFNAVKKSNDIFENNCYKFNRRIKRFLSILNSNNKILFVYMKEYKINSVNKENLNKEKEHDDYLKKINLLLKEKNVYFSLLIIDFSNKESIKEEGNVITITLELSKLQDYKRTCISNKLSKYLEI